MNAQTTIWNALSKTDPGQTKQFKRAGGFEGTAIKPIWIIKRLTEQFGPVGTGWGMGEPSFQVTPGHNGEVMVYCTVRCWHTTPENAFYGVGGDKIVSHIKANQKFNRPERWESDDEAFKKAFTDAVGNAFKFVGIGADIHMGQFDDSKYVRQLEREFAEQAANDEPAKPKAWREPDSMYSTPTALHKGLTRLERELAGCGDTEMVYALCSTEEWREFARIAELHSPHYLRGGPPAPEEFEGLLNTAERMVREFDSATANHIADIARS